MTYIPEATLSTGFPSNELDRLNNESQHHFIYLPPFYMGKYLVTQLQWEIVAKMPKEKRDIEKSQQVIKGNQLPVEVRWHDAVEFCARLSRYTEKDYHLPSDVQWEYACRAGTTTPYYFGETISVDQVNHGGYYKKITPVGQFPPNDFGLYDMHGNAFEWCKDADFRNPENWRIICGGDWSAPPELCRADQRCTNHVDSPTSGFRVVCSVPMT